MTATTPHTTGVCAWCGGSFVPRPQSYGMQRTCSRTCGAKWRWQCQRLAILTAFDAASMSDVRMTLLTELNRGIAIQTLAELHGMGEMTLWRLMHVLGIRRVVRYE